jgi:hypothetical protein
MKTEKKTYKMSTGLTDVIEQPSFATDAEAWEYLRKKYDRNAFAWLYRLETVIVPIVNRKDYVKQYNSKYTLQKIGRVHKASYWVPVLTGLTFDEYKNVK